MLEISIYHPQIPQNTGTLLRLSSCLGIHMNIIGPMGFILSDAKFRRAGMDYISTASYEQFSSFDEFLDKKKGARLVALEVSDKSTPYTQFKFSDNDILIAGSEHSGFENNDLNYVDECVIIPMVKDRRSMNVAISLSLVLGEAMRQLKYFDRL